MRKYFCLTISVLLVLMIAGFIIASETIAESQLIVTHSPKVTPNQAPEGCWITLEIVGNNLPPKGDGPSVWFSKKAKKTSEFTAENSFEISPAFINIIEASANKVVLKVKVPLEKEVNERNGLTNKSSTAYVKVKLNEETMVPLVTFNYSDIKTGRIKTLLVTLLIFFVAGLIGGLFVSSKEGKRKIFTLDVFCKSFNGATYSLTNTQILFWTFITVSCIVYIWIMTGLAVPLNESILILLGIGVVTSFTSRSAAIAAKSGESSNASQMQTNLKSQGLFVDIISFRGEASIFKLQMLIFTLVIGAMVINSSFVNLQFPKVDETYLWLIGISNGTYAGDKIIFALSQRIEVSKKTQ